MLKNSVLMLTDNAQQKHNLFPGQDWETVFIPYQYVVILCVSDGINICVLSCVHITQQKFVMRQAEGYQKRKPISTASSSATCKCIGPSMPFHKALSRSSKFCLLPSLLPDGRSTLRKYLAQTYCSFSFRGYHGKEALWTAKG